MQDGRQTLEQIKSEFEQLAEGFQIDQKKEKIAELEQVSVAQGFWDDQDNARSVMQELDGIREEVQTFETIRDNLEVLLSLAESAEDAESLEEDIRELNKLFQSFKMTSYLGGDFDKKSAVVSIHAGQGGTEAMDWSSMLFRMYTRYCERRGWKYDVVDMTEGEEAGIKSVTFEVFGNYAYGYLKGEAGAHRLVRKSPFNANNLRQTSFALVEVMPELDEHDLPDIEIKDEDIEIQFYRSGGHGGQNVNKVSTAVRLIHTPTGVTVTAQTERFQEQNRKIGMNLLRARLWARQQAMNEAKVKEIKGDYRPASWGNQIRSYVLDKKMVKDLRTDVETGDTDSVLDGDLQEFIEAELRLFQKK